MAEQQPGLSTDPSKINQYGANPADLQEYQDSLQAQIKSLEDRYSNPNWFKVAAGFLKPQLGGFGASLGSASEALGENVEAGRAAALPIAQMRSQLAQSKIALGQNQKAAQMLAEHTGPVTADFVQQLEALGDTPSARAARKTYESANTERGLASSELGNALSRIALAKTTPGMTINPADLAIASRGSSTQPPAAGKQAATPALTPQGEPATFKGTPLSPEGLKYYQDLAKSGGKDAADAQSFLDAYQQSQVAGNTAPSAVASAPAQAHAPANPLTIEQQAAINNTNAEELKAVHAPKLADILQHDRQNFSDTKELLKSTSSLVNDPEVAKGLGLLYGDPGFLTAAKTALAKGLNISASGGVLGGNISASLPVEDILKSSNLSEPVQKKVRQVALNLSQLEAQNVRQAIAGVGAGGHANVPEFNTAMSRVVSGSDPQEVLRQYLAKETVKNMRGYEHNVAFNAWRKANPGVPNHEYVGTSSYNGIADKYAPDLAKAYGNQ